LKMSAGVDPATADQSQSLSKSEFVRGLWHGQDRLAYRDGTARRADRGDGFENGLQGVHRGGERVGFDGEG
jgi:hypothetical protein